MLMSSGLFPSNQPPSSNASTKIFNFFLLFFVMFENSNFHFFLISKIEAEEQSFGTGVCRGRHAD